MADKKQRYFTIAYDVPQPDYGNPRNWVSNPVEMNRDEKYLDVVLNETYTQNAPCKIVGMFFMDARSAMIGKRLMVVWERETDGT